jgi:1-acyl-sn-glycerol-3-phosphate acyltransferase
VPSRSLAISYQIIKTLIQVVLVLITRTNVRGSERVPRSGAAILVSNHLAAVDPAILVGVLPRPITLMSKVENDRGPLKYCMRMVGAFTVRRGKIDRVALRTAERVLAEGRLLCMFPEGTRSASLGAGHGGAVMLALKSGAPIIPVALTGTSRVFIRHFPWIGFPRVTVVIGEPFSLQSLVDVPQRADRERLTNEIMVRIAALLPPELRGNYRVTEQA